MAKYLNDETDESYVKATLYGRSGVGKTTLGCTAPEPLILLSERQGYRSVKDAARRLGIPLPPTIWIQSLSDLMHVLLALQSDPDRPIATALRRVFKEEPTEKVDAMIAGLPYAKPSSIVLDSTTEMFALISDDIERIAGKKIGRDGLEAKPERYWGVLRDRSESMIRKFRDLPYHVFFLALLKDATIGDGEEQSRIVEPAAPMKALPGALAAAVNLVGLVSVSMEPTKAKNDAGESVTVYDYRRWVRFAGPQWMLTKSMEPLAVNETPNISDWLDRIAHEDPTTRPLDLAGPDGPTPDADATTPATDEAPADEPEPVDAAAAADVPATADDDTTAAGSAADDTDDDTDDEPEPKPEPKPEPRSSRRRRRKQQPEASNS